MKYFLVIWAIGTLWYTWHSLRNRDLQDAIGQLKSLPQNKVAVATLLALVIIVSLVVEWPRQLWRVVCGRIGLWAVTYVLWHFSDPDRTKAPWWRKQMVMLAGRYIKWHNSHTKD